ncbi:MAG: glycosyltransferase family 2 protein [Armatimonadetes bacterium]|nr:glycosyltransferase family 2 protein [Armatimonadota bacterium]
MEVAVIIPALNEEQAIGQVLAEVPRDLVCDVIVVDNGSTDGTAAAARAAGARVVAEARRGYGSACLRGIAELRDPDVVVFLDGDHSDCPEELPALLQPIAEDRADLVIGSRTLGRREARSLTPQQLLGNRFACFLFRLIYRRRFTDLGPFRAIRRTSLLGLGMVDPDFGWTIEMQIKAVRAGLRVVEVPVRYRPRIGRSKISGTLRGTLLAGYKIITTILRYAWR